MGLFRLLHPDLGATLARYTSRLSEFRIRTRGSGNRDILYKAARRKIAHGVDIVIHGHYHFSLHARVGGTDDDPEGRKRGTEDRADDPAERSGELVVLGDWIQKYTYAVLENGSIRLEKWEERGSNEPAIAPEEAG